MSFSLVFPISFICWFISISVSIAGFKKAAGVSFVGSGGGFSRNFRRKLVRYAVILPILQVLLGG